MKLSLIFILIHSLWCNNTLSQRSHGFQFFVTPYNQELGNLNNRYTSIECETVSSKFKIFPSYEFGGLYHHNFSNRFGWGIGSSFRFTKSQADFAFTGFDYPELFKYEYHNQTTVNYISVKLQSSYQLNRKIAFNVCLNFEESFYGSSKGDTRMSKYVVVNSHLITSSGVITTTIQSNEILIYANRYQFRIVPEVNMNIQLYKNLKLNLGFRCKFWKSNNPMLVATVNGFNGAENNKKPGLIYKAEMDNREYSLLIGLIYELKYPVAQTSTSLTNQ